MSSSALPVLELSQADFDSLPEYSCSIPTGKTIGKRWKRNINFGGLIGMTVVDKTESKICGPEWRVGEYAEDTPPNPDHILIKWYEVSIKEKT